MNNVESTIDDIKNKLKSLPYEERKKIIEDYINYVHQDNMVREKQLEFNIM